jgi:peptide deformylase
MTLKILQAGEPVLRQKARALSATEILSAPIQALIAEMKHTMHDAPGVGLAAPQIGESLQLAVIEDRAAYTQNVPVEQLTLQERKPVPLHVIINPKLTLIETSGEKVFFEGCLSIAGFVGLVPRTLAVRVECLNENAAPVTIDARGWYARILQHEIGHLQGNLCIDHAHVRSWMTVENYMKHWREKPIEETYQFYGI